MKKIAIAFLAAASLASFGCKKKSGTGEAMELLKKYKADLCACKDHDMDCGKKATDAYTKASTDLATKNAGEKPDNAKPDPDMEKLTTEVADCSKRVMTPDMGAAGGGAAAAGGAAPAAPAGGAEPAAGGAAPAAPAGGAEPAAGSNK